MVDSAGLPLLFLDVDGPFIPFGATPQQLPDGYPTYRSGPEARAADAAPAGAVTFLAFLDSDVKSRVRRGS